MLQISHFSSSQIPTFDDLRAKLFKNQESLTRFEILYFHGKYPRFKMVPSFHRTSFEILWFLFHDSKKFNIEILSEDSNFSISTMNQGSNISRIKIEDSNFFKL